MKMVANYAYVIVFTTTPRYNADIQKSAAKWKPRYMYNYFFFSKYIFFHPFWQTSVPPIYELVKPETPLLDVWFNAVFILNS